MLIYNFQKEFLGIDEKDLNELGYHDLSSLRSEVTDFADLFVKTPGYVHNFKHVHWIDFIDCADDGEIPKVIINANGKNFRANLSITHAYLTDNPISHAYLVNLNNLRVLSADEVENIHDDIMHRPTPTIDEKPQYTPPPQVEETYVPPTPPQELIEPARESDEIQTPVEDVFDSNDVKLDIDFADAESIEVQESALITKPQQAYKKTIHKKEKFDNGYTYDPEVASKELGLPLDLIEEFIQDFIAQAADFKPELYAGINDGDIDTVKTLSHKLKGVAANLRIEDAFETLATINTSSDINVIRTNLDLFYKIIAKLAGEEVDEVIEVEDDSAQEVLTAEEPEDIISFKEEPQEVTSEIETDKETLLDDDTFVLDFKDDANNKEEDLNLNIEDESSHDEVNAQTSQSIYSKEKAANEIGLDIESFNELFNDYLHESDELLSDMHTAIMNDDYELLKAEVIKLKGMSDNMRVAVFNSELSSLMNAKTKEEASALVKSIKDSLNKLSIQGL